MQKKHKPKGLTPADLLQRLLPCGRDVGNAHTRNTHWLISLALTFNAWCITATYADTVYRCGETYSTSSQCANGTATEVKPSSVLKTTGPDKGNTATRDLLDAQALEKQRLQAEQQAAQAAPIRLSTPSAPSTAPSSVPQTELGTNKGNRREKGKGKHARKPNTPYFTAVDPTAAPKKKSTAKAVPASSSP
jgi:hypothetical protein